MLLLVQYCGGRMDWRKLRRLRSCEEGAVQSLSLVLTLPVFLMLVLFIVQVTQVMVGVMMVHYAAFAAARAASVWIPAEVTSVATFDDDVRDPSQDFPIGNSEPANFVAGQPVPNPQYPSPLPGLNFPGAVRLLPGTETFSAKYQKVLLAAVIPCLTISPSRPVGVSGQMSPWAQNAYNSINKLYPDVDPVSKYNLRMPQRLKNKLAYSAQFTSVILEWQNVAHSTPDVYAGPTYNPLEHPAPLVPRWRINEVGFRDPVTVYVSHKFALLPGIGRILSQAVNPADSSAPLSDKSVDRVASQITRQSAPGQTELYTIDLTATATFVNEGYKSIKRHAVQP